MMKRHKFGWIGLSLLLTTGAQASPPVANKDTEPFVVHEWGTFLTMNGSDGVTLDSMYHEEHALPGFVHAVAPGQLHDAAVMMKFETPVIYFYTRQQRVVDVTARFPTGIWTHWYPQAHAVTDLMLRPTSKPMGTDLKQYGCIHWKAELLPPSDSSDRLLPVTSPGSLWNFARQVDAAFVRTAKNREDEQSITSGDTGSDKSEIERYLFYRGLGHANLPLEVDARDGGTIALSPDRVNAITHLFVLRVENGRGVYRYIPSMNPGQRLEHIIPDMANAQPLAEFSTHIADDMADRLTATGLYPKEAQAMVNTWKSSYFQSEGIRVLYVLPQAWTETFIPLEITPHPSKLVRVMVGRTELLTLAREQEVAEAVRAYAAPNTVQRDTALATLHAQGRYIEPILRRLLRISSDAAVREGCRRLLLTNWVNELRAPTSSGTVAKRGE